MCYAAAFILTKTNVYWHPKSDGHENIISLNKLEHLDKDNVQLVRIELTPLEKDYSLPIKKWVYKVDQDILPDWYDEEDAEKRCRDALKDWYKARVVPKGKTVDKLESFVSFVFGTVQKVWNGGTVQEVLNGGTVQEVWNGGTVQKVLNGGTVQKVLNGGTVQEVLNGGTVQEVLNGGTVQKVWNGGTVQKVWNGGTVISYTDPSKFKLEGKTSVIVYRHDRIVEFLTGK